MKQGTVKTLGVAALGAAFAATAAGSASAASPTEMATSAATGLVQQLPVDQAAKSLPAGTAESLAAGQNALGSGAATLPMTADKSLPTVAAGGEGGGLPGGDLLGGLPVAGDAAKGGLPTDAVTGGLPTGAVPGGLPGLG